MITPRQGLSDTLAILCGYFNFSGTCGAAGLAQLTIMAKSADLLTSDKPVHSCMQWAISDRAALTCLFQLLLQAAVQPASTLTNPFMFSHLINMICAQRGVCCLAFWPRLFMDAQRKRKKMRVFTAVGFCSRLVRMGGLCSSQNRNQKLKVVMALVVRTERIPYSHLSIVLILMRKSDYKRLETI